MIEENLFNPCSSLILQERFCFLDFALEVSLSSLDYSPSSDYNVLCTPTQVLSVILA